MRQMLPPPLRPHLDVELSGLLPCPPVQLVGGEVGVQRRECGRDVALALVHGDLEMEAWVIFGWSEGCLELGKTVGGDGAAWPLVVSMLHPGPPRDAMEQTRAMHCATGPFYMDLVVIGLLVPPIPTERLRMSAFWGSSSSSLA